MISKQAILLSLLICLVLLFSEWPASSRADDPDYSLQITGLEQSSANSAPFVDVNNQTDPVITIDPIFTSSYSGDLIKYSDLALYINNSRKDQWGNLLGVSQLSLAPYSWDLCAANGPYDSNSTFTITLIGEYAPTESSPTLVTMTMTVQGDYLCSAPSTGGGVGSGSGSGSGTVSSGTANGGGSGTTSSSATNGGGSGTAVNLSNLAPIDMSFQSWDTLSKYSGTDLIKQIILLILNDALLLLSIIGVISIIITGIIYALSFGDPRKTEVAKKNLIWALTGLVVVISGVLILQIVLHTVKGVL